MEMTESAPIEPFRLVVGLERVLTDGAVNVVESVPDDQRNELPDELCDIDDWTDERKGEP